MGSIQDTPTYSVPFEARQVFEKGILQNPLIKPYLPTDADQLASKIRFTGTDDPSIPINWRFAESVSALKAYEALLVNALLKQRYGQKEPVEIEINTDHAQLFFMSTLIWNMDPGDGGEPLTLGRLSTKEGLERYSKFFKNCDKHRSTASLHRVAATNIYKTKDNGYFHVHGMVVLASQCQMLMRSRFNESRSNTHISRIASRQGGFEHGGVLENRPRRRQQIHA